MKSTCLCGRCKKCKQRDYVRRWRAAGGAKYETHADRFWRQVVRDPESGCWEWTGTRHEGRGVFYPAQRITRAYRFAFELLRGPVPAGAVLHHTCENKGCCNPDHIEPLSRAAHMRLHMHAA